MTIMRRTHGFASGSTVSHRSSSGTDKTANTFYSWAIVDEGEALVEWLSSTEFETPKPPRKDRRSIL